MDMASTENTGHQQLLFWNLGHSPDIVYVLICMISCFNKYLSSHNVSVNKCEGLQCVLLLEEYCGLAKELECKLPLLNK